MLSGSTTTAPRSGSVTLMMISGSSSGSTSFSSTCSVVGVSSNTSATSSTASSGLFSTTSLPSSGAASTSPSLKVKLVHIRSVVPLPTYSACSSSRIPEPARGATLEAATVTWPGTSVFASMNMSSESVPAAEIPVMLTTRGSYATENRYAATFWLVTSSISIGQETACPTDPVVSGSVRPIPSAAPTRAVAWPSSEAAVGSPSLTWSSVHVRSVVPGPTYSTSRAIKVPASSRAAMPEAATVTWPDTSVFAATVMSSESVPATDTPMTSMISGSYSTVKK